MVGIAKKIYVFEELLCRDIWKLNAFSTAAEALAEHRACRFDKKPIHAEWFYVPTEKENKAKFMEYAKQFADDYPAGVDGTEDWLI